MSKNVIVYCVTGPHLQLTAVSIASLLEHYRTKKPLQINVVCDGVRQEDIGFIREMPRIYGKPQVTIHLWAVPSEIEKIRPDFTIGSGVPVPPMAIWRLFMPNYFSGYDKMLYLDNDTMIEADVTEIFAQLDESHVLAAVKDFLFATDTHYGPGQFDSEGAYGIKTMRNYFNNGVMIINVKQFNQLIPVDKLLNVINTTHWHLADQTIINILVADKVKYLPYRYNFQHSLDFFENKNTKWDSRLVKQVTDEYSHIIIRHFAGTGRLTCPYQHVRLMDEWEEEFLRVLVNVKRLSFNASPVHPVQPKPAID
ncbi:glycosyl transferase [Lacticaseibacillus paracasei]|uniref:glycosyltransferase family 8 protein n=1 Tax=Lacticaseibacillus paracasei TaxID=1597 RepID=UPI000FF3B70E|nr:glycosyltransferase [Lacticaseibacillus paracasei]RWZ62571.1 glycosyl transferase [Lacticaseibacillus paracasei]